MTIIDKIRNCSSLYAEKYKTFSDPKGRSNSFYKVENIELKNYNFIKVDDCVFLSDETKCDFAMEVENRNEIYFIELKGSDNNQGLKQLYETIINTKTYCNAKQILVRLIVSRATPPRNLDKNLIAKIANITGDVLNGKTNKFIKTNNLYTEII